MKRWKEKLLWCSAAAWLGVGITGCINNGDLKAVICAAIGTLCLITGVILGVLRDVLQRPMPLSLSFPGKAPAAAPREPVTQ